ncbi:Glyoxalase family protein [hydrothermal vent metagenome]|uniref:Glyoxalase family protein n=1 Tax=hydrothermal vent metagenome TaxID=652676 RepID=A0A3B0SIQ8_9ZZZZ
MAQAFLEHVNFTVSDPVKTAQMLCDLFGWHIRWQGEARNGGTTFHVGEKDSYLAVYTPISDLDPTIVSNETLGGLNHIAVVVEDLDEVEKRVISAGYKPFNHASYEPGKRFYFHDENQIEFEVVSY